MGHVRVRISIGSHDRGKVEERDFLIDTGAYYTGVPPTLVKKLGIEPVAKADVLMADGRKVEAGLSYAYIKVGEREGVLPIAIIDSPEPILGVTALEGLGIKVDPTTGEIEYVRPYGLGML